MDKACFLGKAIKYLENLQERVRMLEDEDEDENSVGTCVKRSRVAVEDEESGDEQIRNFDEARLPEVEARVYNESVLLKIQCEKRRGILVKLLGEVEKLNLLVVNASIAPFGGFAHDVTIIAQMEEESTMGAQDIVAALRSALQAT